ncbi:unnamed protein product [Echinostoma caproni]|uniref:RUN domain-containing protein n=1 Tax=Echinostoma caproni TaxID=27848 RepID=A0A183AS20_9TREM|nr:unnamed protein product [Echinostoma caproni]
MIPSVKERQRGAYDFKTFYEGVCALHNVAPLQSITCHLAEGILDVNVDRIRASDWDPIFKSLRINKNLNFVAFRSFINANDESGSSFTAYRRPTPSLLASATVKRSLCRALRSTLRLSSALTLLELQNIPISVAEVIVLCEVSSRCHCIQL